MFSFLPAPRIPVLPTQWKPHMHVPLKSLRRCQGPGCIKLKTTYDEVLNLWLCNWHSQDEH